MEIIRNEEKNGEYDYYELYYLNFNHDIVSKEEADIVIARYLKDDIFIKEKFNIIYHDSEEENSDSNNKTL